VFRIALRTLKWGTLAAALFVAGVWAGGRRTACDSYYDLGNSWMSFLGYRGGVEIFRMPPLKADFGIHDFFGLIDRNRYDERIWVPSVRGLSGSAQTLRIPYWLPILLFASISGGLFWRDRRAARRARVGMCPSCGYSRAGLALEAVCPECGKPKV
jgi:hypothetical protein